MMPYYGYYFDPTYILIIIGALLSMWASSRVKSTYAAYSRVPSSRGITGKEAAERILHDHGIYDVTIQHIQGQLTDCYIPSMKVLKLSDSTYGNTSIAAIGVAAHECGHAIQHATDYTPLTISNAIHPVCAIGSNIGFPVAIAGILFGMEPITMAGIALFSLGLLISLITLPVEYNASNRALAILGDTGMLTDQELVGTKKVLRAAGLTYVSAAAAMALSLLRLVILAGNRRGRR